MKINFSYKRQSLFNLESQIKLRTFPWFCRIKTKSGIHEIWSDLQTDKQRLQLYVNYNFRRHYSAKYKCMVPRHSGSRISA